MILRTIGIVRARAKIGPRNLAYNMDRVGMLLASSGESMSESRVNGIECHARRENSGVVA